MEDSRAEKLLDIVIDTAGSGITPLRSAKELVEIYKFKYPELTPHQLSEKLIHKESIKNFSTGFMTGISGFVTLPISVGTAGISSWLLQARLVTAVALLNGYDEDDEKVRSLIKLSLMGDAAKEILKGAGVGAFNKLTASMIIKLPAAVFIQINRMIGLKVMQKITQRGSAVLLRTVPLSGGVIAGGIDYYSTKRIGKTALTLFSGH
ncbi:MAG: hypothetical protein JXR95_06410 [Deltaproteobacteria bacterium]|nr:hypothetical protein [Deltaproteobacteria bacterium]